VDNNLRILDEPPLNEKMMTMIMLMESVMLIIPVF